jgi:hypothetical protein
MKSIQSLSLWFMGTVAIALGFAPKASADAIALNFEPSPQQPEAAETAIAPLAIPAQAKHPPTQAADAELPPPPPLIKSMAIAAAAPSVETAAPRHPAAPVAEPSAVQVERSGNLSFNIGGPAEAVVADSGLAEPIHSASKFLDALFAGGADSLVARIVGSAEGTRTADGKRTRAYYGHTDPGNGVWNLGSFSYQHGAKTPEEADQKQIKRLRTQAEALHQKAIVLGLELSLEEKLNGIDLANQAPKAALDRGGYIDWLVNARRMGLRGEEAVLWARTRSFLDPDTQQWNAPGLGNTAASISRDQERRLKAIARALASFMRQAQSPLSPILPQPAVQPNRPPLNFSPNEGVEATVDRLMGIDTDPV